MNNPLYHAPVKAEEEYTEYYGSGGGGQSSSLQYYNYSSSAAATTTLLPIPMEGLHDTGPPPFLIKTFDMVDDPASNGIVSWSRGGQSIVVWDAHAFSTQLLPTYFKHNNFSSFVRQLNTYGFRKTDPDRWEFANELFLQGQKHLLKNIRRRKSHSQPISSQQQQAAAQGSCVEVGRFGLDVEVDQLRRDKQVLFMELVKIRQQHQATRSYLQSLELRLQGTEKKQQYMMSFLAKAMQNPLLLQQLVQQKEKRKQLEEAITKKRRRPIDQGGTSTSNEVGISSSSIKAETLDGGVAGYGFNQVSELEALALEMQGFRKANRVQREEIDRSEFDWGFWDELLNHEVFDELENLTGLEEEEEEKDVNVLADKFGFLGSSSK